MSGGNGACAVCKHQRRKCEPNCELAAYFPANKMNDFRALHLVFGVANLTKMIKANDTETARRRAAETLTWEAQWRERDPADGCYREVSCLQRENAALRAENAALRRLAAQCMCCGARHAPSSQQVPGYGHPNTRPSSVYSNNGGIVASNFDNNCYNICCNNNSNNGGGTMAMRPPAPAPAQMMINHTQEDHRHTLSVRGLANGGHGIIGMPSAGGSSRSQIDSRNKCNTR